MFGCRSRGKWDILEMWLEGRWEGICGALVENREGGVRGGQMTLAGCRRKGANRIVHYRRVNHSC